eukprot:5098353-Amphidinium_carterae.1
MQALLPTVIKPTTQSDIHTLLPTAGLCVSLSRDKYTHIWNAMLLNNKEDPNVLIEFEPLYTATAILSQSEVVPRLNN